MLASGCSDITGSAPGDGGAVLEDSFPGTGDGSFPTGDASSCHPGDVQTYVPTAYRPASAPSQGACRVTGTVDPFQQLFAYCLGPRATQLDCMMFAQTSPDCSSCLLTASTASRYGPLIGFGGFIVPNVAGCLELVGALHPGIDSGIDSSILPCARAVQYLGGCELAACEANCPVSDPASLGAYDICANDADKSGCESYAAAAMCAGSYRDAGAHGDASPDAGLASISVADCFASFNDFFNKVAPLFCGSAPPPLEAGASADAGSTAKDARAD
jgi:hypothetical protein